MTNQMAMITNILPIAFGVFSLQFPAGLVLYFLVSNLWRLGQQEIILRKITRPGQAAHAAATGGAIDVKSEPVPETRGPGGLRKLFQLPAATNGDTTSGGAGNGTNGGSGKPDATPTKSSGSGGTSKGTPPSGTAKSGGSGAQQSSSGPSGRRSNKKRKRR
jgi:YidC/Oxa1 family membrane protein insertase